MSTTGSATPSVLVIGAGFGGLAMALELRKAGFTGFTVLERAADLGGVWRENTYPGVGCDIPSPLYSFSSAPNPRWPKRFSTGADVQDYLHAVVDRFRLDEHIVFGAAVTDADFDEQHGQWVVRTGDGQLHRADVLVPATGQLSNPAMPDIPGLHRFTGPVFHSARWEHDCALDGKRVGVIGTGASAVRAEVESRYDQRLQRRLARSVWTLCSSWYRNAAGRITGNWPGTMTAYRWRTRRFSASDYHFTAAKGGAR